MDDRRGKILVVDDDPDLVEATTRMLARGGFDVVSAPNSRVGMQKAREDAPDLIIIDIIMDTYSEGFSFIRELEADDRTRDIPRVILSSLGIEQQLDMIFPEELGAVRILQKPVKTDTLLDAVRAAIGRGSAG